MSASLREPECGRGRRNLARAPCEWKRWLPKIGKRPFSALEIILKSPFPFLAFLLFLAHCLPSSLLPCLLDFKTARFCHSNENG